MTAGLLCVLITTGSVAAPPPSPYHPVYREADRPAGRATVTGDDAPPAPPPVVVGTVCEPAFELDHQFRGDPSRYEPQPGDIVLFVSDNPLLQLMFAFALTGEPYHAGIVVKSPDGTPAVLEAGPPFVDPRIRLVPVAERLPEDTGRVYVRRRAEPLTAEQCEALTAFARRQKGKPYALLRACLQATPFRCRGPLRTKFIGKCRGECFSYFCSELVMECLVAGGLYDEEIARPRATTPQDLFYDESTNPYINETLKLSPMWGPPQRWAARPASR